MLRGWYVPEVAEDGRGGNRSRIRIATINEERMGMILPGPEVVWLAGPGRLIRLPYQ